MRPTILYLSITWLLLRIKTKNSLTMKVYRLEVGGIIFIQLWKTDLSDKKLFITVASYKQFPFFSLKHMLAKVTYTLKNRSTKNVLLYFFYKVKKICNAYHLKNTSAINITFRIVPNISIPYRCFQFVKIKTCCSGYFLNISAKYVKYFQFVLINEILFENNNSLFLNRHFSHSFLTSSNWKSVFEYKSF